jgi:type IV secretion system protein VirD4
VSRSGIDFFALKERDCGAVIAVVVPIEYKETHAQLARLAMQCAVWAMVRGAPSPHRVLFEIDECASLGRVEELPQWLAELRKYKVQWSLHFQNLGQPKALYQAEWQTFLGNAGLKRFVGARDTETMKEISELCGRTTIETRTRGRGGVSVSQSGRELQHPDEVRRMKAHHQFAFIDNLQPAIVRKTAYWERPEFAGRFHRNPYEAHEKHCGHFAPVKRVWGWLAYGAAWLLTPHPVAAVMVSAAIVFSVYRLFAG